MFEVGFSELLVIAVVALLVLGPERLPKAARMAGSFMRKARNSFESLKNEVERELEAEDLKKRLSDYEREQIKLNELITENIHNPMQAANLALENLANEVNAVAPLAESRSADALPETLPESRVETLPEGLAESIESTRAEAAP